jgi:peptidoglycan/xylan/chitin deacetylase (PgdA/CDA1 family)
MCRRGVAVPGNLSTRPGPERGIYRVRPIPFAAILIAAGGFVGTMLGAAPARAESCPGHPDALGTSRVLVVSPDEYQRLGTMQYKHTLPLADHEVVITFDDGPLPPWSDKALDILTSQCVKATYFIIGKMAQQFPQIVRREYEAGYTIGTHSEDHPLDFQKLTGDKLAYQIDGGIASVSAALGDRDDVAPFFRIPGLGRSKAVEDALAARSLVVFSSDVVADDWFHHITPAQIVQRAMSRLEKRGRGILLLHDIHPWTVAALPELLKELKEKGFHVVQMVPPAPVGPEMAGGPKVWARAAAMPLAKLVDRGTVSPAWPQPNVAPAGTGEILVAPDAGAFKVNGALPAEIDLVDGAADAARWPQLSLTPPVSSDADFAVPGLHDIGVSMRGEELTGVEAAARPPLDRRARPERRIIRHVRLPMRHSARRPAIDHHRADLRSGKLAHTAL